MVFSGWWRRNIRTLTKPRSTAVAEKWYTNLSFLYAFLAWNAVGFGLYGMLRTKKKELSHMDKTELSPGEQMALERGLTNAKIIRFNKGFKLEEVPVPAGAEQANR